MHTVEVCSRLGHATPVKECLDFGSLDFAVLLAPADTAKYDFIELPNTAHWGILMQEESPLAKKSVVSPEDIKGLPLILHRRIELQQQIAHWADVELDELNIVATYNVLSGSPLPFVNNKVGYFLTAKDMLPRHFLI